MATRVTSEAEPQTVRAPIILPLYLQRFLEEGGRHIKNPAAATEGAFQFTERFVGMRAALSGIATNEGPLTPDESRSGVVTVYRAGEQISLWVRKVEEPGQEIQVVETLTPAGLFSIYRFEWRGLQLLDHNGDRIRSERGVTNVERVVYKIVEGSR